MKNKKLYVILGGVLILAAVSVGAFYYIKKKNKSKERKMFAENKKPDINFSSKPQNEGQQTVINEVPKIIGRPNPYLKNNAV